MMRRTIALSVMVAALSIACSRPDRPAGNGSTAAGPPTEGDWVIIRYDSEPENLNPLTQQTANAGYALFGLNFSQIAETLMQYNTDDWTITKPLLAESRPEVSPDHLTYTYTLRDGVKWHDGKPFTAEDVLFSAKIVMCPLVDAAPLRSTVTDLVNVEILEGRKVRFTMSRPYYLNEFQLGTFSVAPKHIFDPSGVLDRYSFKDMLGPKGRTDPTIKQFAQDFNKHPNNRSPIGTGPYKFEKWETGKQIVLARNPDYWGAKPYLDKIIIRIIQDQPAALTALKAGEVDFNPRLLPIQYAQQTSGAAFDQQFTKTKYNYPSFYYIGWNPDRPYFKDKRVRRALTMLIDRQQIIDSVRFGLATIAASHFTPGSYAFNPNVKPLPYDPKAAMQLLDEAGWTDHDGDGIRDKDGVPFRFEFVGPSSNIFTDQLLSVVKEEFRKAGIDMQERRLEFTVLVDSLKDHRFDAANGAWVSDLYSDPFQLWHSSQAADRGSNYVSFKNAEADKLIEQARTEFDQEKRKQLYWRFQEIIQDEQPYTFLFYPQETAAYQKRFQNVVWMPNRPSYDLNSWFVPKAAQKYSAATNVQ